ncbi:MAG: PAS domain S-box protein [Oligoflexus sp.]
METHIDKHNPAAVSVPHKLKETYIARSISLSLTIQGQKEALELALKGAPLQDILTVLVQTTEKQSAGKIQCSILLLDAEGKHLRLGAAPSLPKSYNKLIDGIAVGPQIGSCGSAAYTGETVIVTDIASDPRWSDFREAALSHDLQACWATPIKSSRGIVLGTFAIYSKTTGNPLTTDLEIVDIVTHTAALIIERQQEARKNAATEMVLKQSEKIYHQAVESLPVALYTCDTAGRVLLYNSAAVALWGREPEIGKELWCQTMHQKNIDSEQLTLGDCPMAISLRERRPIKKETTIVKPDGECRHVLAHPQPLYDEAGTFIGAINILVDITDRKLAESELITTKDHLADQVATLTRLHDLVTHLSKEQNLQDALRAILETVIETHHAEFGLLSLYDKKSGELKIEVDSGFDEKSQKLLKSYRPVSGVGACGHAFATKQRIVIIDTETDPKFCLLRDFARAAGFRAVHSTPILTRSGELIGVLSVQFKKSRAPSTREMQLTDMCALYTADAIEVAIAQESLRQSEERLRLALGSAGSGAWDWDIKENTVNWSAGLEKIHGLEPGTFGGTFDDFQSDIHPEDRERVLTSIQESVDTCATHNIEYHLILPDGQVRWVEARGAVICDNAGHAIRMLGVCTDISNRKHAEDARATLEALVESSSDAIISQSLDGTIITWNQGASQIFGYQAEEVVGKHITILTPKGLLDQVTSMLAAARRGEDIRHFETIRRHKDGRHLHVSVSLSPVRQKNGTIIGISKIARDITDEKASRDREQLLAEASELLSSTLDYHTILTKLADIIIPHLGDWYVVDIADDNGLLQRIAFDHRDRKRLTWAEEIHHKYPPKPEDPTGPYQVLRTGIAEFFPEITDEQINQSAKNEELREILHSLNLRSAMTVPLSAHGRTFGVLTLISSGSGRRFNEADFQCAKELGHKAGLAIENARLYQESQETLRKYKEELRVREQTEIALRRAKEAADAASEAKSSFLANMSHEIRTPLGAILGFSDLLTLPGQSADEQQECIDIIKRNGQLLSTLINDILDLSKVEAGKLVIERQAVKLDNLLEEIRSALNLYAAEKGVLLAIKTIGQMPRMIETDEFRLKQILNNIIGNAIKFTDSGSVTVSLQLVAKDSGHHLLYFEVTDTGRGISAEQSEKLFTPFTQADASTSRRYGGTGLGLVLSRKLAKLLGGDVVLLKSEVDVGSTFAISIDPGAVKLSTASQGALAGKHGQSELQEVLTGIRILVVDDSADNRLLISRYLQAAGATVTLACNGQEAIHYALSNDYHAILMDVQMPVMDGRSATKELREQGYSRPIIALTAHAMREEKERCLSQGFNDYYSKPIDRTALLTGLQKYAAGKKTEENHESNASIF